MPDIMMFLSLGLFSLGNIPDAYKQAELNKSVEEYRVYALSKCIRDNYEKMGIDFKQAPVRDYTLGFIDLEMGVGFYAEDNNPLDRYIENKTGNFYRPKQPDGDLAFINLVTYDCIDFYHSEELKQFLSAQIELRLK